MTIDAESLEKYARIIDPVAFAEWDHRASRWVDLSGAELKSQLEYFDQGRTTAARQKAEAILAIAIQGDESREPEGSVVEIVARATFPDPFGRWQATFDSCKKSGWSDQQATGVADTWHGADVKWALGKAELACRALSSQPPLDGAGIPEGTERFIVDACRAVAREALADGSPDEGEISPALAAIVEATRERIRESFKPGKISVRRAFAEIHGEQLQSALSPPSPENRKAEGPKHPAERILSEIEDLFPNWRSYRDLADCVTCEVDALRKAAQR